VSSNVSITKGWKKPRNVENIEQVEKFLIFCEGEQTEPNYFKGFKRYIQSNSIYKNLVEIEVNGVGAETERVLNYAINFVKEKKVKDAQVWCVYDKDSFPPEHFNNVVERIRAMNQNPTDGVKYYAAWSNQCIEYWFVLHFNYYDADNDRQYYKDNLDKNFKSKELPPYEKCKDPKIFEKLTFEGSPKLAIKYGKKRIRECGGQTVSDSCPATKVYELVEKLAKYLPEEIKNRYL
jgi:hypothetical protein